MLEYSYKLYLGLEGQDSMVILHVLYPLLSVEDP